MEKESYNNIIELLKKTLEFYSNENNYDDTTSTPPIGLDKGEQAKNTLNLVKELEKSIESYENDYEKYMKDNQDNVNTNDEANEIINKLKNLNKWK